MIGEAVPTAAERDLAEVPDVLDSPEATQGVIRGSALRTAGYVVATLANVAALPFLFRHLGLVQAGRYVTVISLITILAGIVEVGLTQVSVREYSVATAARKPALMAELIAMRLALLGVSFLVTIGFMAAAGYGGQLIGFALIGSLAMVLENMGSSYNVELATSLRLGWLTLSNVARQIAAAVLTLVLVAAGAPLSAYFWLLVPAGAIQLGISAFATRGRIPHLPSRDFGAWWPLLRRTAPYVLAMTLGFVYFRVPVVLVSLIGSARETGSFGAAFRLVEVLTLLCAFVLSAVVPLLTRAAEVDPARYLQGLSRVLQIAIIIGAGLTAATATGARLAVDVVAGGAFDGSVPLVRALSVILLLRFLNTAASFALLSAHAYTQVLWANLAAIVAAVLVGATTIGPFGASGAVASALAAEATLTFAYGVLITRAVPGLLLPTRPAVVALVAMVVAVATLLASPPALLAATLGPVIFAAIVLTAGVLPPEVEGMLPAALRPGRRRARG